MFGYVIGGNVVVVIEILIVSDISLTIASWKMLLQTLNWLAIFCINSFVLIVLEVLSVEFEVIKFGGVLSNAKLIVMLNSMRLAVVSVILT